MQETTGHIKRSLQSRVEISCDQKFLTVLNEEDNVFKVRSEMVESSSVPLATSKRQAVG